MFFNSKRRQEQREAKRKEKLAQDIARRDPTFRVRLNRNMEILQDSIALLQNTKSLDTLIGRYADAKSAAYRAEGMFLQLEDDCCSGVQDEIDALFVDRLPEVVAVELGKADALKTDSGKRRRWNGIVNALERCERIDGGAVDDAIQKEQFRVFRLLEEGVDWSKEPEQAEFVLSEKALREKMARVALNIAKEKGLPEDEAWEMIKKTLLE